MYVIHTKTGKQVIATISRLELNEFSILKKEKRFNFDWNKEIDYEVYKLTAEGVEEILGLMSLENRPADFAVQIRLLASSRENVGSGKQYQRIVGCLIAFACRLAFKANYNGYVFLKPKTGLEKHYINVYKMRRTGIYFTTEGQNSLDLIEKYNDERTNG